LAEVTDGTTNTAAFSEHITGDFDNTIATENADTFAPGTSPTTPDEALRDCKAINWRDITYQSYSDVGAPWLYGYHSIATYQHINPPNGRTCRYTANGTVMSTANSMHPGGVNVMMLDGSVKFVKSTVAMSVWRAIGTRNGGEVVSATDY